MWDYWLLEKVIFVTNHHTKMYCQCKWLPSTHQRSIQDSRASCVCLFDTLFACQHDNFWTIKHRMMKLGGYVHCTEISPEFKCQGQSSRSSGTKTEKCRILFESCPLGRGLVRHFFQKPSLWALLRRWENQRMLSSSRTISRPITTAVLEWDGK